MKKALFWDFHGTLTRPDKLWSVNLYKAVRELYPGCAVTLEQIVELMDSDGFPWHHPERSYPELTEPEAWWRHVGKLFHTTCLRCGLDMGEDGRLLGRVRERILDPGNYRLYEDAETVLSELAAGGWKHYMVSNNFPELEQVCGALGIRGHFDGFITSALVGYDKPRREIFEIALRRAGFPDDCYMIGDNPAADIEGAKNAGIRAILVNREAECGADYQCGSIKELPDFLLRRK